MKKALTIAAILVAALAVIAATDPLADLAQEIADLKSQVAEMEDRLAYLERFSPVDTFEPIEGAGSTAELAAIVNNRVPLADGIEIAVTGASVIAKQSEIKILPSWARPPAHSQLVAVNLNIYNTRREPSIIEIGVCPWKSHDTLAVDYRDNCGLSVLWNINLGEESYPLIVPEVIIPDLLVHELMEHELIEPAYWGIARNATVSEATMYFHVPSKIRPLDGMLTYKHPANQDSHRYWKLKR